MRLFEILQEFKRDFETIQSLKDELSNKVSEENFKNLLENSFNALKNDLKDRLQNALKESLANAQTTLKQENKQELENLLNANLEATTQEVVKNLDVNAISQKVANALESKNQERIMQLLREVLDKASLTQEISRKKEIILLLLQDKLNAMEAEIQNKQNALKELNPAQEIQHFAQKLVNQNKSEVLKSQNLSFLKETLEKSTEVKHALNTTAKQTAQKLTTQKLESEPLVEYVDTALKEKTKDVMVDVYSLKEVEEAKLLGALHLQAISLQSEIAMIENTLLKIYNLRQLKEGIKHNILKVI